MRFLKDNFDSIIKLFVNQIGIAIFAFFLYTATPTEINSDPNAAMIIKLLISVFSIIFYYVLIYNVAWEIGAKDKIRIDAGRMETKKTKGLWLGLMANVTNFIILGVALITYTVYLLGGPGGFKSVFVVLNAIFRIFISMYIGVLSAIYAPLAENSDLYFLLQTIGFLVFTVISALVVFASYLVGLKDYRIFGGRASAKKPE